MPNESDVYRHNVLCGADLHPTEKNLSLACQRLVFTNLSFFRNYYLNVLCHLVVAYITYKCVFNLTLKEFFVFANVPTFLVISYKL